MSDNNSEITYYPIRLQLRRHIYGSHLYDVDGFLILDKYGAPANVFKTQLREMMQSKEVRIIRDLQCGYRYFVRSEEQKSRFIREREFGCSYYPRTYHVYHDDDCDFTCLLRKGVTILRPSS